MLKMNRKRVNKRGQLTIFIIIAIVIAVILLLYFFYDDIAIKIFPSTAQSNFQKCVQDDLDAVLEIISNQGGSIVPAHYTYYDNHPVEYLCYTNQYYTTCVNQQPMLKSHIERELNTYLEPKLKACAETLKKNLQTQGYEVRGSDFDVNVELVLNNIEINIDSDMTLAKEGEAVRFSQYGFSIRSSLYNLIMFTNSILNWEAQLGDSETTTYMGYYPNLRVEKFKQGDGTKIYTLTDRLTGDQFVFASRSLSWPPGYGYGKYITS